MSISYIHEQSSFLLTRYLTFYCIHSRFKYYSSLTLLIIENQTLATRMSTIISSGLQRAHHNVQDGDHESTNKKIIDIERNTRNIHENVSMTSDHGVKIENTDQWLRVIGDNGKSVGPSLLEDQLAREKVSSLFYFAIESTIPTNV